MNLADGATMLGHARIRGGPRGERCRGPGSEDHPEGARIALTVILLVLLAVVLTAVVAPWAPERAEAAAALFSCAAGG